MEALVKDLQRLLITNDVNIKFVSEWTKTLKKRALEEKPLPGVSMREHVVKVVYEELEKLLGKSFVPSIGKQRILLMGIYGAGKTSSAGKLARFYSAKGLKVVLVGADVHRPAAKEQLRQLAEQVRVDFFTLDADAVGIAKKAKELSAKYDVVILDSAGRSAFDEELAKELKEAADAFKPDASFLVVSADAGQVAGKQAKQFATISKLDGVILTKFDGSGKGGGALSSVVEAGCGIAFVGTGEKMADFEVFDAPAFASRLLGFPDLKSFLEKAKSVSDEEKMEAAWDEGKLDYETFLAQLRAFKKMGPLKGVMQMMGAYDVPEEMLGKSEEKLKQFEAAVLSMTLEERKDPHLMKEASRQERVAKGSGMDQKEIKELVQQFEKANKLLKGVKKNKGLLNQLSKKFKMGA
ncbi:signal recognition particle receptor subunit alpha [Candidatus Micrarchaeota archaeon]|nr:signal recognition particle receptor subunit alpha [Candidatus Micrarchaeota archaeon]